MRKAVQIMISAAIVLLAAACVDNLQNENGQPDESGALITETITARVSEGDTKATIDGTSGGFAWTELVDKIAVHTTAGYVTSEGASAASGSSASFTVSYTGSRDAFAIYPSNLVVANAENYGQEGHSLDVTLPATYTLADVSGESSPCPLIATNTPGSGWEFKQLCGLLRLTVNDIPSGTSYLKVDFGKHQVCGDFTIESPNPGSSTISTLLITASSPTNAGDKITITDLGEVTSAILNIPLPTGQYGSITVSAWNGSNVPLKAKVEDFVYTAKRQTGKTLTTSLTGPLTGVFKVGSKYVVISPGNLQARTSDLGATWTWQFAANQWEFMGNKEGSSNIKINGAGTVSSNGIVDLFAWVGTSNTSWSGEVGSTGNAAMHGITNATTMGNATDYGDTVAESLKLDWGETIGDGKVWRTLNKDEWKYLLAERSGGTANGTSKARLTYAIITDLGVNGFILFPDGATIGTDEVTSWGNINGDSGSTKTQCTSAQWSALEAKGCMFLPAPGHRRYFSSKWEFGSSNYYWSSSYRGGDKERAVAKSFDNLTGEAGIQRQRGCAVRLVRDL